MAHLWQLTESGEWTTTMLDGARPVTILGLTLARQRDSWFLFVQPNAEPGAHVVVNGRRALLDIVGLEDRDEIRVGHGAPLFFSNEALASIEPAPVGASSGTCPRCRLPIEAGQASVKCPACGLRHHQTEKYSCWTYDDHCAGCPHPSAIGGEFRWTPEDL